VANISNIGDRLESHKEKEQNQALSSYLLLVQRLRTDIEAYKRHFESLDLEDYKAGLYETLDKELYFFKNECECLDAENKALREANRRLKLRAFLHGQEEQASREVSLRQRRRIQRLANLSREEEPFLTKLS
jgi:hypothetical protein